MLQSGQTKKWVGFWANERNVDEMLVCLARDFLIDGRRSLIWVVRLGVSSFST